MATRNNRKIKIVFIIDTLVGFAGTERHLYETVRNLNWEVFSPQVISFNTNESIINEFMKFGVSVTYLPLKKLTDLNALKQFMALYGQLKEIKPDIVQTFHLKADTFGIAAARAAGVPLLISSRRDTGDLKKGSHIRLNRLANRWVDGFIAVCEAVAKTTRNNEGVATERIKVIYNGVDTSRFRSGPAEEDSARKALGVPPDAFVAGIVSNFRPEKDLMTFFRAMVILKGEIPGLMVIASGCGKGEAQKAIATELSSFCEKNGLSSSTIFPGYASDVRPYISAMDVACLTPVSNEGFSNAILEEMSMGKPVVATDVGGNRESVVDGQTGFIIEPGNPGMLAEKILALYRDPATRKLMGAKARERAEKVFSIEGMIGEMEGFYMTSLERKLGPGKAPSPLVSLNKGSL